MTTVDLPLPKSIEELLAKAAEKEGVTVEQLITSAVTEKVSALMTAEFFQQRSNRANRAAFDAALASVPNAAPVPGDELPEGWTLPGKP